MIQIKKYEDGEAYIEDNYEFLYATLKGIGDVIINKNQAYEYRVTIKDLIEYDSIEKELLQKAIEKVVFSLDIYDSKIEKKVFSYFYHRTPYIVGDNYIYKQKKDKVKELAKLAGF
ncbi:hypothetical protein Ccar_16420 [Clostridium carboxidivorans P7]|uniref:hypothetical protein n=1 Tax=Clostridium carboxidivorans TaxID=217159 RepID=UPI00064FD521|nr:hypothetical protein [Clostridium carboxidivorans]AKN32361.1 hypothetical protein Ccar_16420 [Clostridium carboxidivorans P7]